MQRSWAAISARVIIKVTSGIQSSTEDDDVFRICKYVMLKKYYVQGWSIGIDSLIFQIRLRSCAEKAQDHEVFSCRSSELSYLPLGSAKYFRIAKIRKYFANLSMDIIQGVVEHFTNQWDFVALAECHIYAVRLLSKKYADKLIPRHFTFLNLGSPSVLREAHCDGAVAFHSFSRRRSGRYVCFSTVSQTATSKPMEWVENLAFFRKGKTQKRPKEKKIKKQRQKISKASFELLTLSKYVFLFW